MRLRDRIPVEQLDDERLTNVERRLVVGVSELSTRAASRGLAPGWLRGAGVLAIAAAAVLGWKLHAVPAIEPPPAPAPAAQHFTVADGSRISVDGATLAGTASYAVTHDLDRVVIDLQRGRLELAVVHDPQRTLVIRAADTEIEDVGTRFRVDFDGANGVQVRVTEGEVKITRHGSSAQVVRVAAGNGWTTDRGLLALAELDPVVVAMAVPVPAPARPHLVTLPPAPRHAESTAAAAPHREPAIATPPAPSDRYVELRTAIRSVPLERAPNIDGHIDAANEIGRLKKRAYSTTVGPEASQALYQIAVLLYRPLGQEAEAMHTLDWYFRRFAGGKDMHAAMWLRVRIACEHAIDETCRRAAYSYQHAVPAGPASDVAVRITNAQ
ncbi:MAG: FecR family protein [Kofleriaceae bacterium]